MSTEGINILLVEDDPADLELALHALRSSERAVRILSARDGAEALDLLFTDEGLHARESGSYPKLILLDLKLPKVDGLEVLRQIKNDPRTKALPVVVLTSSKQQEDLVRSYQLGVNSYIQKPVDFDQFREIIRQVGFYWLVVNQSPPPDAFLREPGSKSDEHRSLS